MDLGLSLELFALFLEFNNLLLLQLSKPRHFLLLQDPVDPFCLVCHVISCQLNELLILEVFLVDYLIKDRLNLVLGKQLLLEFRLGQLVEFLRSFALQLFLLIDDFGLEVGCCVRC